MDTLSVLTLTVLVALGGEGSLSGSREEVVAQGTPLDADGSSHISLGPEPAGPTKEGSDSTTVGRIGQ